MTLCPVLVIGARSDIGNAVAHKFASLGHPVQLAARSADSLAPDKTDLEIRYKVSVSVHEFDALDLHAYEDFVDSLPELPGIVVCAVGLMGDQSENQNSIDCASKVIRSNFEGPANIFAVLANRFESRGSGSLVGISSVAGERGRASNYIYGSAKAGFTAFLSGLRNRLAASNVHVVTVLPGFVDTQMTEGMDLPKPLTAQPEEVADTIAKAVKRKKNVVYVRPIWAIVMLVIRNIPESVFKKLKI